MEITKDIVILYHGKCQDGFAAAWAAWEKFGEKADYIPVINRPDYPHGLDGKEVYIVDFSYDALTNLEIEKKSKKLVILDHHVTSKEATEAVKEHVYDLNKSGAYIAWEYFHPGKEVPILIKYISDHDIWTHKMPNYKEIDAYIYKDEISDNNFLDFRKLNEELENENGFKRALEIGEILNKIREKMINSYADLAEKIMFEGYEVYAVNAPRDIRSELGHLLAERTGTFAIVYYYFDGFWRCSLRSVGDFDVGAIAKKYGFGGHKNAARLDIKTDFPIKFPTLE